MLPKNELVQKALLQIGDHFRLNQPKGDNGANHGVPAPPEDFPLDM